VCIIAKKQWSEKKEHTEAVKVIAMHQNAAKLNMISNIDNLVLLTHSLQHKSAQPLHKQALKLI
jgi:hypothetical protein